MAREVVTHIWCDVCMHTDDVYTEATETPPIVLGNMKPRVLALCDVHTKEVYEPIKELLTELGQVADAAKFPGTSPGSGTWPCPDPACHKHDRPFKHEQSLRNHSKQVHGMTIAELRRFHAGEAGLFDGEPEVQVAATPPPKVTEAVCDQRGCDVAYTWPEYKAPAQAMGVHRAKAHGIRGAKHKGGK